MVEPRAPAVEMKKEKEKLLIFLDRNKNKKTPVLKTTLEIRFSITVKYERILTRSSLAVDTYVTLWEISLGTRLSVNNTRTCAL